MRYLLTLTLFAAACAGVPESGPHYDSVQARLSEAPAWLFVHDESSTGTVTARHLTERGWISRSTEIAIEHGHLRTSLDDNGQLTIDQLELAVAPFTLVGTLGKPAQLQNVILRLAQPVRSDVTWATPDEATATLAMVFDIGMAVGLDGGNPVPMVTQRPPAQNVEVVLTGNGDHVDASLVLDATGIWNCADRVEVTRAALSLGAETAD